MTQQVADATAIIYRARYNTACRRIEADRLNGRQPEKHDVAQATRYDKLLRSLQPAPAGWQSVTA